MEEDIILPPAERQAASIVILNVCSERSPLTVILSASEGSFRAAGVPRSAAASFGGRSGSEKFLLPRSLFRLVAKRKNKNGAGRPGGLHAALPLVVGTFLPVI